MKGAHDVSDTHVMALMKEVRWGGEEGDKTGRVYLYLWSVSDISSSISSSQTVHCWRFTILQPLISCSICTGLLRLESVIDAQEQGTTTAAKSRNRFHF